MKTRSLKIERTGNAFQAKPVPRIRLGGKWLERAGFIPGQRVELHFESPGALVLRCVIGGAQ